MLKGRRAATKPETALIRLFKSKEDWAAWLEKNDRKNTGLWLRLAKKNSGLRSVNYKEALEVALCYGWIDGQKRPEDEQTWLQNLPHVLRKASGRKSIARRRRN